MFEIYFIIQEMNIIIKTKIYKSTFINFQLVTV